MTWDHASIRECDWVPGCYYLIRNEVIRQVGLFDPRFFLYYEEVDHCRAVRDAGWRVIYYPHTQVTHIGGESAKTEGAITDIGRQLSSLQIESELLYFRKYFGLSGVFASIALSLIADVTFIIRRSIKRIDIKEATAALRHISAMFKILFATGLASRPTR
jgi:N-acetylglucosaminyl-diphospho-decaprenol L-rhamnosyltransferase